MASEILCSRFRRLFHNDYASKYVFGAYRHLTSGEVSTALRPFYFTVHPDLFGQFPSERAINENSLQVLSSFLEGLQQNRYTRPTTVKFFLKPQKTVDRGNKNNFIY
ncbi:T-cell activation inhibitor, mitochondrial-like [Nilaparvata lugens]|uniref:T-cell activation inhibitor, mitochondrial-like n=1 Tax=Nilaparvata lugens TaxID=108931 RepID=UPI00193C9B54|nr:T-cell activation inhibitor, mitochondrial-like [Nilaparvata lugens]